MASQVNTAARGPRVLCSKVSLTDLRPATSGSSTLGPTLVGNACQWDMPGKWHDISVIL